MRDAATAEAKQLRSAIARLRASVMAIVFGLTGGVTLFLATAWLLILGGDTVGHHLSLLGNYFPGYSVTWPGSAVGFLYGALSGAACGWTVAWIYNLVADSRSPQ